MNLGERISAEVTTKIEDADFLMIGRNLHRNHKNKKLVISDDGYLHDIYKDQNRYIVILKSTQCGASEYLFVRTLARAIKSKNILYILPTFLMKNLIVTERINKSIAYTDFYQQVLNEEKSRERSDNTSIKQMGMGSIIFTGSNTETAFIGHQIDDVIIDEIDMCAQQFIPMAEERQAQSEDKYTVKVGNPTLLNFGIDLEYNKSDKKKWFIKAECGHWLSPDFFKHVVLQEGQDFFIRDREYNFESVTEPRCICDQCGKPFNRFSGGRWEKQNESQISGYHISKMFSTYTTINELITRFSDGLANETIMQRFYNGDLGLAYTAKGAKIDDEIILQCAIGELMPTSYSGFSVMGIDVGKILHVRINGINENGVRIALYVGIAHDEKDILDLWKAYNCRFGIIDAQPESFFSKRLTQHLAGMFMCRFQHKKTTEELDKNKIYHLDRTMGLDQVKEMFVKNEIILPKNIRDIPDYMQHITASTRIYDEKAEYYKWVESGDDHFLFAELYALLAQKLIRLK